MFSLILTGALVLAGVALFIALRVRERRLAAQRKTANRSHAARLAWQRRKASKPEAVQS